MPWRASRANARTNAKGLVPGPWQRRPKKAQREAGSFRALTYASVRGMDYGRYCGSLGLYQVLPHLL